MATKTLKPKNVAMPLKLNWKLMKSKVKKQDVEKVVEEVKKEISNGSDDVR